MRKKQGSALVDYVIPTAVVGLVAGLGLFNLSQNGDILNFTAASGNMNIQADANQAIVGKDTALNQELYSKLEGGSLDGTPDAPAQLCEDGSCIIDFGTFSLSNVPENFNEIVETTGASGGTEKIYEMLEEIANQLENTPNDAVADDIRILANLGHNMALIEKVFEDKVTACGTDSICVQNLLTETAIKPAEYNETYAQFPAGATYSSLLYDTLCIGEATSDKLESPTDYTDAITSRENAALFISTLDSIMNDSSVPEELRGVVQELSWDIGVIGEEFQNNVLITSDRNLNAFHDPLTGERSDYRMPIGDDSFEFFDSYNASTITNLDSSIICAAGYNEDTGTSCH